MVVIAGLLLIAVVALTVGAFLTETDSAGFEILEESFAVSGGAVFIAGLLTGLLTVATVVMLQIGIRRAADRRREIRELRAAHARSLALERERAAADGDDAESDREALVRPYVGGPDRPGLGERDSSSIASRPRDGSRPLGASPPPVRPGSGGGSATRLDPGSDGGSTEVRRPMR